MAGGAFSEVADLRLTAARCGRRRQHYIAVRRLDVQPRPQALGSENRTEFYGGSCTDVAGRNRRVDCCGFTKLRLYIATLTKPSPSTASDAPSNGPMPRRPNSTRSHRSCPHGLGAPRRMNRGHKIPSHRMCVVPPRDKVQGMADAGYATEGSRQPRVVADGFV
jgi:hypothetical protein